MIATVATMSGALFAGLTLPIGLWLLFYAPGACLVGGWSFTRSLDRSNRRMLAVPLSIGIAPVMLNPIWHVTNRPIPLAAAWFMVLVVLFIWSSRNRRSAEPVADVPPTFEYAATRRFAWFIAAVVGCSTVLPYWPTELLGFPVSASIHDFVKHHGMLASLERRPLPLGDIFYAGNADGPVYYYHFFYLLPATLRAWTGASNELCFGLSSACVSLSLASLVFLISKRLKPGDGPATLAVVLVTICGGLDVIPILYEAVVHGEAFVVTLDAWAHALYRIHHFLNQMMWSPQNVLGITVGLLSVYLLSVTSCGRVWRGWLLWGPVLGASIVGSSIWAAMGMLPALAIWVIFRLVPLRREPERFRNLLIGSAVVAIVMVLLSMPSLYGYLETSERHGKSLTMSWMENGWAVFGRLTGPSPLANILDLPFTFTIELGAKFLLLFLIGKSIWRRAWEDAGLRLLMMASCLAIAGYVTVRSNFFYNDFGQKIMMIPMALGAILSSTILDVRRAVPRWYNPLGWRIDGDRFGNYRRTVGICLAVVVILGLPVMLWEAPGTAVRRYVTARSVPAPERHVRSFLRYELPESAVLQADLHEPRATLAQISRRQIGVMADQDDILVFKPADTDAYEQTVTDVERALKESTDAATVAQILRGHHITHVLIGDIERQNWHPVGKLNDGRYFKTVFEEGDQTVVEIINQP